MTRRQIQRLRARAVTIRNRATELFWDVESLFEADDDDDAAACFASGIVTSSSELILQFDRMLES